MYDKEFRKHISSLKIRKAVRKIARKLNKDYKAEKPLFISVLNGSFLFAADLVRKINFECEISFIKVASYSGTKSTGKISTLIGLNEDLKGRSVIILEDIVDSGRTLERIKADLKKHGVKKIRVASLFFKPGAFKGEIKPEYVGMDLSNDFIVGYGLDYNGLGRNLQDIYVLDL